MIRFGAGGELCSRYAIAHPVILICVDYDSLQQVDKEDDGADDTQTR